MIDKNFKESFSPEWYSANIKDPTNEVVILRGIIPWQKIINKLCPFYHQNKGPTGKSLRVMVALLIIMRYRKLSDREVVQQVKENRYLQYFCNVPDDGLQNFIHPTSLVTFRKRLGEKGIAIIEETVFKMLRQSGMIQGDNALIDSTVLNNNIVHPNDVNLINNAFEKMKQFARLHNILVWWDDDEVKKMLRGFRLCKKNNRLEWLVKFNVLFVPALSIFNKKIESLEIAQKNIQKSQKKLGKAQKRLKKAQTMLELLTILKEQTLQKIKGEIHIQNRIVSLDEPEARPIVKGKQHPSCEFGTTAQMSFNREGFMITVEIFIGTPNDKTLFPETMDLFTKRLKEQPETVVTDLGYRSSDNAKVVKNSSNVFLGRSHDVSEEQREFCCKARSATEGFIAVAKNLRGFGCSLYRGLKGDKIWSLLCQTAYNLRKFILLLKEEKIEESVLCKLNLA